MMRMEFLKNPNLPERDVKLCAVSERADFAFSFLKEQGIEVFQVEENQNLPAPCSSHPDMRLCYLGEGRILADCKELAQGLKRLGLSVEIPARVPQGSYPGDSVLNVLFLERHLFCRKGTPQKPGTAKEILQFAEQKGIFVYPVKQGYTRCSVCVVSAKAVVTADPSISAAAEKAGADVLRIRPGHISLPGYEYGFIGGCTGLLGPEILAVCGCLESHPDGERILDFVRGHGVQVLSIPTPDGKLWDIGGIVPLGEG